jgi:hypothetical protein
MGYKHPTSTIVLALTLHQHQHTPIDILYCTLTLERLDTNKKLISAYISSSSSHHLIIIIINIILIVSLSLISARL